MIDQQTINQIFATADIVEVISDFVTLKRSGSNYKGLSPFTNEKTPSFMVSPAKGIFKDFSSGKGGNVVGFLMEHEKLTYPEALRYLAQRYNIPVEEKELTAEEIQQKNERESLMAVSEFVTKVHPVCIRCGAIANYSHRLTEEKDTVVLGEKETYEPLCRKCYNESKNK